MAESEMATKFDQLVKHIDQPGIDSDPERDILKFRPGVTPTEAQAIQMAVKRRRAAAGDRIVGHQASFTSPSMRALYPDSPFPMVGTLLSSMIRTDDDLIELESDQAAIESELAVILRKDLAGPDLSPIEVLAAIEGFLPAIEVAPIRSKLGSGPFSWPHMIACQKAYGGFIVLGPKITSAKGIDPRLEGCLVTIDGVAKAGAIGAEAMGNPLLVIAAMAKTLHGIGEKLCASQVVLTGSLPPPQLVSKASSRVATVEFQTLGSVSIRLKPTVDE